MLENYLPGGAVALYARRAESPSDQLAREEHYMTEPTLKLNFPTLNRLTLRNFSLFTSAPEVSEQLRPGVFCLAGANGLGKSTFLSAANFALTGLVPDPGLKFQSVDEYYKNSRDFAREYFTGRISEDDRDAAEVSLEFVIGDNLYTLTRGLFDGAEELRQVTVQSTAEVHVDGVDLSEADRHTQYAESIVKDIGLASFEQFAFLQHFILTFDERRHLLFWDSRVLEQALFLAFGVDPAAAKRADVLRREAEKADSLARNANWQATEVRKKMKDLASTAEDLASGAADDIASEHKAVTKQLEVAQRTVDRLEAHQRDLGLELATLSSRQASLRLDYQEEFARRIGTRTHVTHHPLVTDSLEHSSCGLCGATGAAVVSEVRKRSHSEDCPLCGTTVESPRQRPKDITRLRELDASISQNKSKLEQVAKGLQRLQAELPSAQNAREHAASAVRAFEKENYSSLIQNFSADSGGGVGPIIDAYKAQMTEFLEAKKRHYLKRDDRRRELRALQRVLEQRYSAAEEEFVPMFRQLAFQFLGLDLDVRMDARAAPATLVLEVKNQARRQHHQLSESQRFFIDIALRMALVQFMSGDVASATLCVDTPEGSLDIAYENRAGSMLALFVQRGFKVLMTANINSSRLLLALAEELGTAKMQLCRMTSWTELSEVQEHEEALFEKAYSTIEAALEKREGVLRS